ncbi:MAG: DUF2807 domain-containing protein [Parabacteroides sp.]|nr:DUF2807 domain-containing protein [Parabacteroides sp.]
MKTTLFLPAILLAALGCTGCIKMNAIYGNAQVITREVTVEDFNEIGTALPGMVCHYEQRTDTAPYCRISTDSNLFDLLEIKVNDRKLRIGPKEKNMHLKPTHLTVTLYSSGLNKIGQAGSGTFHIDSRFTADTFTVNQSGSGAICLNDSAEVTKINCSLSGNCRFDALHLCCDEFTAKGAGANKLVLGGQAGKASFSIAGWGRIQALDCTIDALKCQIAGSGNIEAHVTGSIQAKIAGNGQIRYTGDSAITKNLAGSGYISRIGE